MGARQRAGWGRSIGRSPRAGAHRPLSRLGVRESRLGSAHVRLGQGLATVDAALPVLNAIATDYSAFNARGGKLIMYTGLADPVVSPLDTIEYYERVAQANGGLAETRPFLSLLHGSRNGALWRRHRHERVRRPRRARGMGGARHRAGQHPRITLDQRARRSHAAAVRLSGRRPLKGPEASMTRRTSPVPRRGRRIGRKHVASDMPEGGFCAQHGAIARSRAAAGRSRRQSAPSSPPRPPAASGRPA